MTTGYWIPRTGPPGASSDFLDGRFEILYIDDPTLLAVSGVTGVTVVDVAMPTWHQIVDSRGAKAASGGASITRALADQTSLAQPTQIATAFTNLDGRYTPGQPESDLYGKFKTNTLLRVGVGEPYPGAGIGNTVASATQAAPSLNAAKGGLLICAWIVNILNPPAGMTSGATTGPLVQMTSVYQQVGTGPTGIKNATAAFGTASEWGSVSALIYGGIPLLPIQSGYASPGDITLTSSAATVGMWLVAVEGMFIPFGLGGQMSLAPEDAEGGWIPLADSGPVINVGNGNVSQVRVWARRVNRAGPQTVTFLEPLVSSVFSVAHHAHLYLVQGPPPFGVPDAWSPRGVAALDSITQRWDPGAAVFDGLDPDTAARTGFGYDKESHGDVYTELTGQGILSQLSREDTLQSALTRAALLQIPVPVAMLWPMETGTDATLMPGFTGLPEGRLSGPVPHRDSSAWQRLATPACGTTTPLGRPVDPLV